MQKLVRYGLLIHGKMFGQSSANSLEETFTNTWTGMISHLYQMNVHSKERVDRMGQVSQADIEQVIERIKRGYDPEVCGFTAERSRGNSNDVFEDGHDAGYSMALYEIGKMLGIDLPEPDEPEY
ncbi:hypothetical protein M5X00_26035 [Paenibacillus alvei]|uniref:hypothetical protein n=1 Tax=Paenibacillus alvei TaxID=44250 RepID=UPI00227F9847|nr:hypothetical protein [Paenibacillus alvei]MCY9757691.1 hypothetical protein [Paenibacillus alvei]